MAYTAAQEQELIDAIATGAASVTLSGPTGSKAVTFRSLADMQEALGAIQAARGTRPARRRTHVVAFGG